MDVSSKLIGNEYMQHKLTTDEVEKHVKNPFLTL